MKSLCRILFIFVLTTTACSPQKRLSRLVARHPELLRLDTVHVRQTVVLPPHHATFAVATDRLPAVDLQPLVLTDTKTGIAVTVARKPRDSQHVGLSPEADSLTISVTVPPDTAVLQADIPIKRVVVVPPKPCPRWKNIIGIAALLLIWLLFWRAVQ